MRKPLIVGNWKMNTDLSDAIILANSIKKASEDLEADIVICPPFVWLVPLAEILERAPRNLSLGAQNVSFADSGPLTGEISPLMLKDLVKYVIIGHSERRLNFHESDELISDKIHIALKHNITPIICVGELKKMNFERQRGRISKVDVQYNVTNQLKNALSGLSDEMAEKIIVTYEPIWAISKGTVASRNPADGAYANEVILRLRKVIEQKYSASVADHIRILYGGSVAANNIQEFILQPEIDGVLVGGASLKAKEFIDICKKASSQE